MMSDSTTSLSFIELRCKLVLVGETSVGKSCIAMRLASNKYSDQQESTIAAAFVSKPFRVKNETVYVEIWDTAGQERFHCLVQMYYRGAHAAIVVYEIQNRDSFERAKFWVREIYKHGPSRIIIALVGNKLDLADIRAVPHEEAKRYAMQQGLLFYETSAKNGRNIRKMLMDVLQKFIEVAAVIRHNNASSRCVNSNAVNMRQHCCS